MAAPRSIETRLVGLLTAMLALAFNPMAMATLFTADGTLNSVRVIAGLWVMVGFLLAIGLYLLIRPVTLKPALAKRALLLLATGFTFYVTVLADRMLGLFLPPTQSLIFPPNSAVRYQTAEFDFTARTNNLGFRDRDFPLKKGRHYRILVLGDSFTFGWGVELEDTWVKKLEQHLQKVNPEIEVLNLGRSGGSPETYADIAARALPLLQPDLVVVAVLQGNDLYQSFPGKVAPLQAPPLSGGRLLQIFLGNAYPNLLRLSRQAALQAETQPVWQQQAATLEKQLTDYQKKRLQKLDPQVLTYFRAGRLNPDLVYDALRDPEMYRKLEQVNSPALRQGAATLDRYLKQIRDMVHKHRAQTWVVSVPNKYYLCSETMREHTRLGLAVDTGLVRHNAPDSILTAITTQLQLPAFDAPKLKSHCPEKKLYYTYDGHFTPLGNTLFAEEMAGQMATPLRRVRENQN